MNEKTHSCEIDSVAAELVKPAFYQFNLEDSLSLPSLPALTELMQRLRAAFFPGFHSPRYTPESSARHHLAANLDSIRRILAEQIRNGFCLDRPVGSTNLAEKAEDLALGFIKTLPRLRHLLEGDVKAAYEGDPAAKTPGETIFCYPSIQAMTNHRVAHELYRLGVPLMPRIISEMAHASTGIDIHPGAQIGDEFFIDHGTGVVVGETCIIGRNCRLYQGVTLGALSFPKEQDGSLSKGLPRHPILEDNVVVYSGATILGRVTIGQGSVIGGNVWITSDVPAGSKVIQQHSISPGPKESMLGKHE
ncbi:MAG: serine acetyltransferase [Deltaproteobacteria bacterium]|jgi:serine O-acetyltransferase|nr:serine acetyltransferase [Deltaproteobacteria bacterium]